MAAIERVAVLYFLLLEFGQADGMRKGYRLKRLYFASDFWFQPKNEATQITQAGDMIGKGFKAVLVVSHNGGLTEFKKSTFWIFELRWSKMEL